MKYILSTALILSATSAFAHGVESAQISLPAIGAGDTYTASITCSSNHTALSAGHDLEQAFENTLAVTGVYPTSDQTWAADIENKSGRPTAAGEGSITLHAVCR